jgi:hypothetical protein
VLDEIAKNSEEFMSQLSRLQTLVEGQWEQVVRKTAFDLYARIIKRTPFKTGRARQGWGITVNEESSDQEPGTADIDYKITDDSVIIYNNVEYISYLEDGWSKKAPEGMVAVSLADFAHHFQMQLLKTELGKMGGFVES